VSTSFAARSNGVEAVPAVAFVVADSVRVKKAYADVSVVAVAVALVASSPGSE
jgi:hypothetical protein